MPWTCRKSAIQNAARGVEHRGRPDRAAGARRILLGARGPRPDMVGADRAFGVERLEPARSEVEHRTDRRDSLRA